MNNQQTDHENEVAEPEESFDAGNQFHVDTRKKKSKSKENMAVRGLVETMNTRQGRAFLWSQLAFTGVFRCEFHGNAFDSFNIGMRNAGNYLFAMIRKHCKEQYLLMEKEAEEDGGV